MKKMPRGHREQQSMSEQLMPCPWCGSGAFVLIAEIPNTTHGGTWWRAGCKGCGISFPNNFQRDGAIREWNTRAESDEIAALKKELDAKRWEVLKQQQDSNANREDVASLRAAMMYAINHAGGKVDDECSTDFLCMGADQIKLFVDHLKKDLETARAERNRAEGFHVSTPISIDGGVLGCETRDQL